MEVKASVKSAANWTSLDDGELTGRKQYFEMNALSSGTNSKPSSSYRVAVCGEHATYNSIISTLR